MRKSVIALVFLIACISNPLLMYSASAYSPSEHLQISTESIEIQATDGGINPDSQWWNWDLWYRQALDGDTWITPGSYCNFSITLYARTANDYPPQPNAWDGVYVLYFREGRHTTWSDFYYFDGEIPTILPEAWNLTEGFWSSSHTYDFKGEELEEDYNADPMKPHRPINLKLAEGVYTYFLSHGEFDRDITDPAWEFEGPKINNYIIVTATWEEEPLNPFYQYLTIIMIAVGVLVGIILLNRYIKSIQRKILVQQEYYMLYTHPQICKDGSKTFCPYPYIASNTYEPKTCTCIRDSPAARAAQGYSAPSLDRVLRIYPITRFTIIKKWF